MTPEEIMQEVGYLPTYFLDDDIRCLHKYSNLIGEGSVWDIGTGWGKSTVVFTLSNPKNKVYSCDPGDFPIELRWAMSQDHYEDRINEILARHDPYNSTLFFRGTAEEFIRAFPDYRFNIILLDNWPAMNDLDSSLFLKKVVGRLKKGGYVMFRNYGRGDRPDYTASVDRVVKEMKLNFLEKMAETSVWQI